MDKKSYKRPLIEIERLLQESLLVEQTNDYGDAKEGTVWEDDEESADNVWTRRGNLWETNEE